MAQNDGLISAPASEESPPVGYLELLRTNRGYRRIWSGALISLCGDWFSTIAIFSLLLRLTGRGEAVALTLIARFLPSMVLGPIAGVVADRFPRRKVMVACDVLRAVVVLGFLLVKTEEQVWLVYALTLVQYAISAFFDPAEQAAIGSVVRPNEVVTANTLHSMTWSATLAFGAMIGGFVTEWVGAEAAFVMDALSYVGSAVVILGAPLPVMAAEAPRSGPRGWRELLGVEAIADGFRLLARDARVRAVLMAKAGWGLALGGGVLLYPVFAERVFAGGAQSMGFLYGARGVGALVGPPLARHLRGDGEAWLGQAISLSFCLCGASYVAFALSPTLGAAAFALCCAHAGASIIWTFSSALINRWVPDELRGRVFAADISAFTLTLTVSTWATGRALDAYGVSPRALMLVLAAVVVVPLVPWRASRATSSPAGAVTSS